MPLRVYADELSAETYSASAQSNNVTTVSELAELMSSMHYETMKFLQAHHDRIAERLDNINTKLDTHYQGIMTAFTSLKTQVIDEIDTKQLELLRQVNDHYQGIMTTFSNIYTNGDYSLKNVYEYLTGYNKEHLNAINKNINDKFSALSETMQQQSSDIQQNADKNSQNQIDNANKNQNEIMNGDKEYEEYEFSSGLNDVLIELDNYCSSLDDTLLQINNASESVSEYLTQGTSIIEGVLGVFPSILIALVTFGIVFVFARKVVGR